MNIISSLEATSEADAVFGHMVEMAIIVTRLVVEYAKHLPGFQTISKDDQIALLKASGVLMIHLYAVKFIEVFTNKLHLRTC